MGKNEEIVKYILNNESDKTHLEILKDFYEKFKIKYHLIVEDGFKGKWTYLQPYSTNEIEGYIYVHGYGLVELKSSGQLTNFIEFDPEGNLASY